MKTQLAIVCALAQGASFMEARIGKRFEVENNGVTFDVDYNENGSRNPYSVIFRKDGVRSKYRFRETDGFVRKMNIGSLRYSAVYRSNGDLKRVNDLNGHRVLLEQDADEMEDEDEDNIIPAARRLDVFSCDDCETVWTLVCNGGMYTLCDEINSGVPPLNDQVVIDSIDTMCYDFRPQCVGYTAEEICSDQCEECDRALAFSLEWDDNNTDMDLKVDEPVGTQVRWNNREGNVGYLDQDNRSGGPEIYRVWNGLSTTSDDVLGTYTVAARLVYSRGGPASVNWKLTAEMDGTTVWTETGTFDTNGQQSDDFTYNLGSYIDNGCDNEVLASLIAVEGDSDTKPGSP